MKENTQINTNYQRLNRKNISYHHHFKTFYNNNKNMKSVVLPEQKRDLHKNFHQTFNNFSNSSINFSLLISKQKLEMK